MESDDNDNIEVVGGPPMQDESGPSAHTTKCRLCKKNKWLCIGLPRWMCNKCTKAKAKCNKCYGTRSRSLSFRRTFTTFDYGFPFYIHCSYHLLCWHFPIRCMVVNSSFLFSYFLSRTLISQVDDASTRSPLVIHSMSFYHVPLLWSVRIPRTHKYSTLCTIYFKLVLVVRC